MLKLNGADDGNKLESFDEIIQNVVILLSIVIRHVVSILKLVIIMSTIP